MNVGADILARQREELLPRPRHRLVDGTGDREGPHIRRDVWRRTGGEDREVVDEVLTGWDPRRIDVGPTPTAKPTRDPGAHAVTLRDRIAAAFAACESWVGARGPAVDAEELPVLAVTENATSVIQQLTDTPELPDGAGLRIASSPEPPNLTVTPAGAPEEGDQVVENDGARVFLESEAATILDDKVLDARVNDAGGVEFLVAAQA